MFQQTKYSKRTFWFPFRRRPLFTIKNYHASMKSKIDYGSSTYSWTADKNILKSFNYFHHSEIRLSTGAFPIHLRSTPDLPPSLMLNHSLSSPSTVQTFTAQYQLILNSLKIPPSFPLNNSQLYH